MGEGRQPAAYEVGGGQPAVSSAAESLTPRWSPRKARSRDPPFPFSEWTILQFHLKFCIISFGCGKVYLLCVCPAVKRTKVNVSKVSNCKTRPEWSLFFLLVC